MAHFPHPKSLKLRNFKGIVELDLTFDESLTLLAGVNGVGKTSVLQALLATLTFSIRLCSKLYSQPHHYPIFDFPESVARAGTTDITEIVLELSASDQPDITWGFEIRDGRHLDFDPKRSSLKQPLAGKFQSPPPLVVYYAQNRVAYSGSDSRNVLVSSEESRRSSLRTTISSPGEFKAWFFEKEADEGQEIRERQDLEYADPELAAVRQLLKQLDGFTAVRSRKLSESSERTLLLVKDGADIPFDSLSGGEQAFFLLAADLARRLMLESPGTPIAKVPGIVCIDEIELHLHPAWQRKILKTLMEMFPACQFVVSTHSPQVISSVEAHHIRVLTPAEDGLRKVSQPVASKGHDSNYVLKGILDTPEREDDVSELFDQFDDLIDERNLEDAERVLAELDKAVEGGSSRVATRQATLNRLRRAAE